MNLSGFSNANVNSNARNENVYKIFGQQDEKSDYS